MNGYIKYFENEGKNMSLSIKNNEVQEKYEDIWNVVRNKLNIKFHSQPIYENKYLKAKVREFNVVLNKTSQVMVCQKKILIIHALLAQLLILLSK